MTDQSCRTPGLFNRRENYCILQIMMALLGFGMLPGSAFSGKASGEPRPSAWPSRPVDGSVALGGDDGILRFWRPDLGTLGTSTTS